MYINYYIIIVSIHVDIVILLDSGCSCSYSTSEGAVPQFEVCAVIQFINGTQSTTSDYSAVISPDTSSASAQRTYCMHRI